MKIAFVYDRVNKFGGAERVLLALHEIWPDAPLYTAIYNKEKAAWADVFEVIPSLLNKFPFSSSNHEIFPLLTPFAFESFDFRKFDVVLSVTSSDAKGIITNPNTLHICYVLTPTRYLWGGFQDHLENPGFGRFNPLIRLFMKLFSTKLRVSDFIASSRPDVLIAISKAVSERIKSYYRKDADVIYPPVDIDKFHPSNGHDELISASENRSRNKFGMTKEEYYLIVSRLVPYKRIDYAISAFNELGWKLKIIGHGIDEGRLKKLASANVEFIDSSLTDEKLCWYYQNCKALIFPGEEDFGISAVEAQACGKPVIGIGRGGLGEIVIPGVTGELYSDYSKEALISALKKFIKKKYKGSSCCEMAAKFAKNNFKKTIESTVDKYWRMWKDKN